MESEGINKWKNKGSESSEERKVMHERNKRREYKYINSNNTMTILYEIYVIQHPKRKMRERRDRSLDLVFSSKVRVLVWLSGCGLIGKG